MSSVSQYENECAANFLNEKTYTGLSPIAQHRKRSNQATFSGGSAFIKISAPKKSLFCLPFLEPAHRKQKICLRYFKIPGTYFKICALYFFFSPMWV